MARRGAMLAIAAVAAAQPVTVTVDWSAVVRRLVTTPALQVVVNPLILRDSPVYASLFRNLAALGADYVRFVPWLPYPRLGVAELEPPSGTAQCGLRSGNSSAFPVTLSCAGRGTIASVDFAVYGEYSGFCGSLKTGSCGAPDALSVVRAACLSQTTCTIPPTDAMFGPSGCAAPGLAIQIQCSQPPQQTTYWNFTLLDQLMADFLGATANHSNIINFSTPPQWLYATPRVAYPDDPKQVFWSYESGNQLVDPTAATFGAYYGRLLAWYTDGGFTDENGDFRASGHAYNITTWEILNEIEGEHGLSPQQYVVQYDAVVAGMRKFAPKGSAHLKFMGLALESFSTDYLTYFLNASNHAPGTPLDFVSWHRYASCSARGDPTTYTQFFDTVDGTTANVAATVAIRDALSPSTKIDLDELGVILPDDNDPQWTWFAPGFPRIYWNAAAAMYAYMFAQWSPLGVDVLGESQYVGYPENTTLNYAPQFPSVAMTNWSTGAGTARYWVLKLLLDSFSVGDAIVNTTITPQVTNPFCGSIINLANLTLQTSEPDAVIDAILFASYGTPSGNSCGHYAVNASCNAPNSTTIVESYCLGQSTCAVPATTPIFGDPCYGTVKHLVVEAHASKGGGFQPGGTPIGAQAYVDAATGARRVLVINKQLATVQVTVAGATGGTWNYVDETTGDGHYGSVVLNADTWTLQPFAAGVLTLAA